MLDTYARNASKSLQILFYPLSYTNLALPALKSPQPPPSWTHTSEAVLSITKDTIEKTRKLHDHVAALLPSERSYESVILPLADSEAEVDTVMEPLSFYQNVSPSKELRDASNEAEVLLRDFSVEASMRVDVFDAIKGAAESVEKSGKQLSPEEKRLVEKMLLDGKRAGLDLPEEKRNELTEVCDLFYLECGFMFKTFFSRGSSRRNFLKLAWNSRKTSTRKM